MEKLYDLVDRFPQFRFAGLMLAAISGLSFTLSNFMVQVTVDLNKAEKIPVHELVFTRNLEQLVVLVPIILIFKLRLSVERKDIITLVFMSFAGFLTILFMYLALDGIPISDVLVITFTSPVYAAILAFLLYKEKTHWLYAISGGISFIGVIIVARPTFLFGKNAGKRQVRYVEGLSEEKCEIIYLSGIAYALLSGLCSALYFVLARKFATDSQNMVNMFYLSLTGVLCTPLLMLALQEPVVIPSTPEPILSAIAIGIFSSIGLLFLTLALALENATGVSLARYLDIIYAYALQYFVMGIKPSWWSIGGGVIIACGTTLIIIRPPNTLCRCMSKEDEDEENSVVETSKILRKVGKQYNMVTQCEE